MGDEDMKDMPAGKNMGAALGTAPAASSSFGSDPFSMNSEDLRDWLKTKLIDKKHHKCADTLCDQQLAGKGFKEVTKDDLTKDYKLPIGAAQEILAVRNDVLRGSGPASGDTENKGQGGKGSDEDQNKQGGGQGQTKRRKVVVYARDGTALRKGVTVVKEEDDWPMVRHQLQDEFKQSGINLEFDGVRFYGKSGAVYLSPKVMFMGGEETEAVDLYTSEEDAKKDTVKIGAGLYMSNTHAQLFDRRVKDGSLVYDPQWADREVQDMQDDQDLRDAWQKVCKIPVPPHDNAYAEEHAKYSLLQGVFYAIMRAVAPAEIFTLSNVTVSSLYDLKPDSTHTVQENVPEAFSIVAVHEVESCISGSCNLKSKSRTPAPYVSSSVESKGSTSRKSPRQPKATSVGDPTDSDTFLPEWEEYANMNHALKTVAIKHANHFKDGVGQALNYLFALYTNVGYVPWRFASASDVRRIVFIGGKYESELKAFYSKTYDFWTGKDQVISDGFRILFKLIRKYARSMRQESVSASSSSSTSSAAM